MEVCWKRNTNTAGDLLEVNLFGLHILYSDFLTHFLRTNLLVELWKLTPNIWRLLHRLQMPIYGNKKTAEVLHAVKL